ncbi:MAG TPA: glycosyltransferase [Ignavibacteria bacterium]|nr:glycosyltransferase [Ignavibacteria bacterium]
MTDSKSLKKILIVIDSAELGGAERQAIYLYNILKNENYLVNFLILSQKKGIVDNLISNNDVFRLSINKKIFNQFNFKIFQFYELIKNSIKFIRIVRKLKCNLIIPFTYYPNIICNILFKFTSVKSCVWNQRDEGRNFNKNILEKLSLKNASILISNSTEGKLFLEKIIKKSVKIIFNGIQNPKFVKNYINIDNQIFKMVMVANLHQYKDHITLLKTLKILIIKYPNIFFILTLVGRISSYSAIIFNFVKDNNLEDNVVFKGFISDTGVELIKHDLCVFSSVKEGLPNGILECMALGLPVVATKINGSIDALGKDYEYFAKPFDEIDFAKKIEVFINCITLRKSVGNKNKVRVNEFFSLDTFKKNYIEIINSL